MDKSQAKSIPNIAPLRFFGEVMTELRKVTWPSREETIKLTVIVIIVSVAVGLFIGSLDILFIKISALLFRR